MRDWIIFYVLMTGFWVSWFVGMVHAILIIPKQFERGLRAAQQKRKKTDA
jgi:hypothetical protein